MNKRKIDGGTGVTVCGAFVVGAVGVVTVGVATVGGVTVGVPVIDAGPVGMDVGPVPPVSEGNGILT